MAQDVGIPKSANATAARTGTTMEIPAYASNGESPADLEALKKAVSSWRQGAVAKSNAKVPPRKERFSTWSDLEVADVLTPADMRADYMQSLGLPGEYPFTRG